MKISEKMGFVANDLRLQNLSDEFINIIEALAKRYAQTTKLRQGRTFHKTATTLHGKIEILQNPQIPAHQFLSPGKQYSLIIRHANGVQDDDAAFDNRGATLRVLNSTNTENFSDSLLDLLLTTGDSFFSRDAKDFFAWMTCSAEERDSIARQHPHLAKAAWEMMRFAESYTELYYYSKVVNNFIDLAGNRYLVKFRLTPAAKIPESGLVENRNATLPPDLTKRDENDHRPKDYLHQDLRKRIAQGGINYLLQLQIRAKSGDIANAMDCTKPWPESDFPWLDVAGIHLNKVVDNVQIEPLAFNPFHAPADLSMPLASSITDPASLNHLRSIIYTLSSNVRLGVASPDIKQLIMQQAKPAINPEHVNSERRNTVCVIGAGPSGLIAAKELTKLGYEVIVLERHHEVGGKCRTISIDGLPYNLGGHVCTSQYSELMKLLSEYGIEQDIDSNPYHYDIATNQRIDLNMDLMTYRNQYETYQQIRRQEFAGISKPGFHHVARALSEPIEKWTASLGLTELKKRIANVYTSSGYGYVDGNDVPALYFAKLMEMLNLQTPLSLNWTVKGGFQVLWNRIVSELKDIRFNTIVEAVERKANQIRLQTNKGIIECQKLVIACPFDQALSFLDATEEEAALFSKIRYSDYYTSICRVNNIPKNGFYFIQQHCQDSRYVGHSVAFLHRHANTNVYSFYSYGSAGMNGEDIIRFIKKDVAKMGGEYIETLHQEHWRYFPHVDSHTSNNRFFQKMEELQGKNATLYVGSLLNFELVECNIAYAKALIEKLFTQQQSIEKLTISPAESQNILQNDAIKSPSIVTDRKADMVSYLKQLVATAQSIDKELVDENMEFFAMGLDSLKLADMMQEMMSKLNIMLNPSVFFEYTTIDKLAEHLIQVTAKPENLTETSQQMK